MLCIVTTAVDTGFDWIPFFSHISGLDDDTKTDKEDREEEKTETESEDEEEEEAAVFNDDRPPTETPYSETIVEELGQVMFMQIEGKFDKYDLVPVTMHIG